MVNGIVDYLEKNKIRVFGPKNFIPIRRFKNFLQKIFVKNIIYQQQILEYLKKKEIAVNFLKNSNFPTVIKADNLSSWKRCLYFKNFSEV